MSSSGSCAWSDSDESFDSDSGDDDEDAPCAALPMTRRASWSGVRDQLLAVHKNVLALLCDDDLSDAYGFE